jgi:hypothetical protein
VTLEKKKKNEKRAGLFAMKKHVQTCLFIDNISHISFIISTNESFYTNKIAIYCTLNKQTNFQRIKQIKKI